jgi:hypothetical protein
VDACRHYAIRESSGGFNAAARHQPYPITRHKAILNLHSQCHFFSIAAYKLREHQKWVLTLGFVRPSISPKFTNFHSRISKIYATCVNTSSTILTEKVARQIDGLKRMRAPITGRSLVAASTGVSSLALRNGYLLNCLPNQSRIRPDD